MRTYWVFAVNRWHIFAFVYRQIHEMNIYYDWTIYTLRNPIQFFGTFITIDCKVVRLCEWVIEFIFYYYFGRIVSFIRVICALGSMILIKCVEWADTSWFFSSFIFSRLLRQSVDEERPIYTWNLITCGRNSFLMLVNM